MLDKESDFRYVSFRNDSGELIDLDLSVDLLPLRTDDEHAILAGKDIAFLYESITERKFAAAIGSADDIVSFSRQMVAPSFPALSTHPAPDPGYRNRLVTYALDESVTIPRVVYTDESAGDWSDFIEKASIPRVTVEELPIVDRIIRKEPVLAVFDNQAKLNRFYTPNLSTVRDVTDMRVEAYEASAQSSEAYTESLYPHSGNNIYPPSVTASSGAVSVQSEDGEIVAFMRQERTSYQGIFNRYGHGASPEGFIRNRWSSRCVNFAAYTGYDLYQLSAAALNIAVGAKYRAVFHFAYSQRYSVSGFENDSKNYAGSSSGYGYLIGDEATVPEYGVSFVPRSNVFTAEILLDIRKHYQKIDPISGGFMSATNAPRWDDLKVAYSSAATWQDHAGFARNYDDSLILKPLGYIVTLGNHTRWKS